MVDLEKGESSSLDMRPTLRSAGRHNTRDSPMYKAAIFHSPISRYPSHMPDRDGSFYIVHRHRR